MGGWKQRSFFDLYTHNFVRVTTCVPRVKLADPKGNLKAISQLYEDASNAGSALVVFPELCICGYSLDDLLQQDTILEECIDVINILKTLSMKVSASLIVGAPLLVEGRLHNCAVVISGGSVLGIVPKLYLPNMREFYESRQFLSGTVALQNSITFLGEEIPFRSDIVFQCKENPNFTFSTELCQDLWVPIPPCTFHAWRGATVMANLSASNITINKSAYRHDLVKSTSARLYCAYMYTSAGQGESTNDLSWDGQAIIYENGSLVGETGRFEREAQTLHADIDLDVLIQSRNRDHSWAENAVQFASKVRDIKVVSFSFKPQAQLRLLGECKLGKFASRHVAKRPYVPSDPATLEERCYECYNIQVSGLVQRLKSSGIHKVIIGISGGLDSTHALLVCCQAMDHMDLPRSNILAYTMPGFATGEKTKGYAWELMNTLGVTAEEIDIKPSCMAMLRDLKHPFAQGVEQYDVTFENVQAGERTSHLFRLANMNGGLVIGTGDLSEIALGWCTYGVGDHMSHYGVNAGVPKSLIQCVIQWVINSKKEGTKPCSVLQSILSLEISPELIPQKEGDPLQSTEDSIGPYDLHDFQTFYTVRYGFSASKIAYLATYAWANDFPGGGIHQGADKQPSLGGNNMLDDRSFALAEVLKFQRIFFRRFFLTTQFKRTCTPNAPKVQDGASLSPRGDWRAPSDSSWLAWCRAWERTVVSARTSALELELPTIVQTKEETETLKKTLVELCELHKLS
eukprot:m.64283 g.64283  ORF g.64283 m.64283 type:complete len:743 (+) comp23409_c0_seq1:133-2361(+)